MDDLYSPDVGGESGVGGEGREDPGSRSARCIVACAGRRCGEACARGWTRARDGRRLVGCLVRERKQRCQCRRACPPHTWRRCKGVLRGQLAPRRW
eukprot:scaffold609_cov88-Isochrysis_galbana.AAC.3